VYRDALMMLFAHDRDSEDGRIPDLPYRVAKILEHRLHGIPRIHLWRTCEECNPFTTSGETQLNRNRLIKILLQRCIVTYLPERAQEGFVIRHLF
jgi:hypothetical protein